MLPERLLLRDRHGEQVVPRFLRRADLPWIERLLDEHERFVGNARAELERRLAEADPALGPPRKRQLAARVLAAVYGREPEPSPRPRELRALVFGEAAQTGRPREEILAAVGERVGLNPEGVERGLFADLGDRRGVAAPEARPSADEVLLRGNLLLAQGLLFRASRVRIRLLGNARLVVRHARLRGLLCEARSIPDGCELAISGPFSMFRHTLVYGRALASLLPTLPWCRSARLQAELCLPDGPGWLRLDESAPIFPSERPRPFDSSVEERFARDFRKIAPSWDVIREPEAVPLPGGGLLFPDFLLRDRARAEGPWLLEIAGFWTPEYLARKLAGYRRAGLSNLVLCIDAERNVSAGELPADAHVLRYRQRVDANEVLRALLDAAGHAEAPKLQQSGMSRIPVGGGPAHAPPTPRSESRKGSTCK